MGREKTLRTCTAARRPAQVTFYDLSFCSLSGKVTGSGSWLCRQNLLSLGKVNGSRRASLAAPPAPQSSWAPGSQSRPSHGARPQTARAPLHRSPDHVGVLEGLQVPQHRHLADGRQRHALLAGLHSHALQRHETASVLQVPGLEHLPIGALPDLRHAFVLLVGTAQAVLLHAARTPPGTAPLGRAGGALGSLVAAARLLPDPRPAPSRPRARSRSLSPPPTTAVRRSDSRGRRGWMERPPRGRAQPWCRRCETPPAESPRSKPIPPLPSPKLSPLYRHQGDYIVFARARLTPQSFHLKEETGGQEESVIRHPRRLPRGSCRHPSSSFTKPPSLPSASSCPLPGRLILPGSSEKSEVTFLSLQSWSRLRAERLQGPLGDERGARDAVEREGACQAAQSVPGARGRGGAGHVNVTA